MVIYHSEFYNKSNETEQWIRLSDGCFRDCWNCYAPKEKKWYPIPKIEKNKVRILDMSFLYAYPNPLETLKHLGKIKVNNKVVYYDFLCGLDFKLITQDIANVLKISRFGRFNNKGNFQSGLRIAWDRDTHETNQLIKCIHKLDKAGYKRNFHQVFMLCNGQVSFKICLYKLKVLAELGIQICDCWYDNQKRGSVKPIYWKEEEIKEFGKLCRAHNIAIQQNMYDQIKKLISEN